MLRRLIATQLIGLRQFITTMSSLYEGTALCTLANHYRIFIARPISVKTLQQYSGNFHRSTIPVKHVNGCWEKFVHTFTYDKTSTLALPHYDKIALVILNTSLEGPRQHLQALWDKAKYRACVDGGINELHKRFIDKYIPDVITGDLDSATKETLGYFEKKGVPVVCTPDQDDTDFTKCIKYILEDFKKKDLQIDQIVAYVSPQHINRFDHTMANINTLFQVQMWTTIPLYLMSENSSVCLLAAGKHRLQVDTGLEGSYCGLIPVGEPCDCVTTSGLNWNLDKQRLKFGELISTSNAIVPGTKFVTIETDRPLLWTMTVANTS